MPIHDLLLPEFDVEAGRSRATLDRVPEDSLSYKPHDKSMALGHLAAHMAQIPQLGSAILGVRELDYSSVVPYAMTTRDHLLNTFDTNTAILRAQLAEAGDDLLHENWKLTLRDHVLFAGSRYDALRNVCFNHLIHHRAQLGVYLRLRDLPVPSIYGPSADEN